MNTLECDVDALWIARGRSARAIVEVERLGVSVRLALKRLTVKPGQVPDTRLANTGQPLAGLFHIDDEEVGDIADGVEFPAMPSQTGQAAKASVPGLQL